MIENLSQDLEELSDFMTGQDNNTIVEKPPTRSNQPPIPKNNVQESLSKRIKFWGSLSDNLDPQIMKELESLEKVENSPVSPITTLYKKFRNLIRDDIWQMSRILQESANISLPTLTVCLETSICKYPIASSKDISSKLADISSIRDDMEAKAKELSEQEKNNKLFQEDLASSWNKLSKSITSYTEVMEMKTLKFSTFRSSTRSAVKAIPKNTASSSVSRTAEPLFK